MTGQATALGVLTFVKPPASPVRYNLIFKGIRAKYAPRPVLRS